MMNKKGFTLMEILFVLLIIALVVSFAVPALRAVRHDIRNSQTKAALKKLLEARRSFYQSTKGVDIEQDSSFLASSAKTYATSTCSNPAASGIPSSDQNPVTAEQLFACGFANWKDFASLPYTFSFCGHWSTPQTSTVCQKLDNSNRTMAIYAMLENTTNAKKLGGAKYFLLPDGTTRYYVAVGWDGQIYENLE